MRDADFMLTAEERRFKQLRRRKIIVIVIGVLSLLKYIAIF